MRIKKIKNVAGITGTIVDDLSYRGEYDVPNTKAINVYSTEEQVIGTWFDKPLYRKVFFLLNISEEIYDFDISSLNSDYLNIETAKCSYINQSSNNLKFGFFNNYYNENTDKFRAFERGNYIRIVQGSGQTGTDKIDKEIMLVLVYTKTTD